MRNGGGRLLLGVLLGCGDASRESVSLPQVGACLDLTDTVVCASGSALACVDGKVATRTDCGAVGLECVEEIGCRACEPRSVSCDGALRYVCSADGSRRELVEACPSHLSCSPAGCRDLCADARAERSYLGCDYRALLTANRSLPSPFRPAVAIGNGNLVPARVDVTLAGRLVAQQEVAPRSSATIELAYDAALQRSTGSRLVRGGAYHLEASVPVTVHQFNPLLFELPVDCPEGEEDPRLSEDGKCYSHTNDASLLLPDSALEPDEAGGQTEVSYVVVARGTFMVERTAADGEASHESYSSLVGIVAGGTRAVTVRVRTRAHTRASAPDAEEPVAALAPGMELERILMPGDALQLLSAAPERCTGTLLRRSPSVAFCELGPEYDLTGTEIRADGPIQVIAGHDCTNVPLDRVACDHLEESLLPVHAWGRTALLTRPRVTSNASYVLRVVSGEDDNLVSFDPPIHEPVTLARGAFVEQLVSQPVFVSGRRRLLVAQYLTGQGDYDSVGDPSMSVGVPVDQYRASYSFLTPSTYSINYLDVVARTGAVVLLDGQRVGGFSPVGASGLSTATVQIESAGTHEIRTRSGGGIGLVLYGLAPYTSYMLPGGLDLAPLPTDAI